MQKRKYKYNPFLIFTLFIIGVSLGLSGCASYVRTAAKTAYTPVMSYESRSEVLAGLNRNYGRFEGISGRIRITAQSGGFSFEQAGLYRYIVRKYMQFTILDIYGDVLFYAKISKQGKKGDKAVFFYGKSRGIQSINLSKKYTGKKLSNERLFKVFKIFLNMDDLHKIKKASLFYNTGNGFFFEYRRRGKNAADYYIYVTRTYLVHKITEVEHKKITGLIRFKDYVSKGGSKVPLKIYVDDYLYNVKIKVALSKGSKVI